MDFHTVFWGVLAILQMGLGDQGKEENTWPLNLHSHFKEQQLFRLLIY